jgi:hypothetical protein
MKQEEVPPAGVLVMIVGGVILLGVAGFLGAERLSLALTALAFGLLFLGLGVYFRMRNKSIAKEWEAAPADWAAAEAHTVEFVYSSEGHVLPGRLVAKFRDSNGGEHEARSGELGFDPRPLMPAKVTVRYQAKDGSGIQSKIDTGFLPQVEFLTWPSLAGTVPEIRNPIMKEGRKVDTVLAGFRFLAISDEDSVQSRMVMLQYVDAAAGKLMVLEGFVVTDEKGPFPDWPPGKPFAVRLHPTEKGLYIVDKSS